MKDFFGAVQRPPGMERGGRGPTGPRPLPPKCLKFLKK